MPESTLDRKLRQFRAALLARERRASSAMVRHYGQAWVRIQGEINSLTKRYYAAIAAGEEPSEFWLLETQRLQSLQRQVEAELTRFAQYADVSIKAQQAEAMQRASRDADALIRAAYGKLPPGVHLQFNRLPTSAIENMIATFQDGSPVHNRLLELARQGAAAVEQGLMNGLATGQGAREIARSIRKDLGHGLGKAMQWSRTETLRAYRKATGEVFKANRDIVPSWIWRSARNERTCAACWAMDGTEHSLEEELDDHVCGRCFKEPKVKTWKELGFDVKETVQEKEAGVVAFGKLPTNQQVMILGQTKYNAWKDGRFELHDLVGRKWNNDWGSMRYEKSLRQLGIDPREFAQTVDTTP